ncbi:MAG: sensor histidine kinase, partial [Sphingomonas sp.]
QEGEAITARLDLGRRDGREMLRFAIDRPRIVAGLDEMALLDPVNSPAGDWPGAPGLGLGFALSLVRKLSQANGGDLAIGADSVQLFVPKAGEDAR